MTQTPRIERYSYRYVPHRPGIESVSVSGARSRWSEVHGTFTVCTVERAEPVSYWCGGRQYGRCSRVGMLVGPGQVHVDVDGSGRPDYRVLRLSPVAVEQTAARLGLPSKDLVVVEHEMASTATHDLFLSLHAALESQVNGPAVDRLIDACISEVVRRCASGGPSTLERREVRRAREYIRENLSEPITLSELAEVAGIGKWGFVSLFREQVGLPPHAYIVQLRLARARMLLATGRPCGEVAIASGFFDQSHLNRWFGRTYGISPREYQRVLVSSSRPFLHDLAEEHVRGATVVVRHV